MQQEGFRNVNRGRNIDSLRLVGCTLHREACGDGKDWSSLTPTLIPGFYKEAWMRMRISTKSMRSPGGFEAEKVGLNKLIMKDSFR
ncbi:hypothetical protein K1719_046622 [Acacia pycnantha]|nr:hypothetical protein K1719_046622 [Acacia pycnantha]